MEAVPITQEIRAQQIHNRKRAHEMAVQDHQDKVLAELQGMSLAERLMRVHKQTVYPYITGDEAGQLVFDVRMITSMEQDWVLSKLQEGKEGDGLDVIENRFKELREKAADLVVTTEVKEMILSGGSPNRFSLDILNFAMSKSAAALKQVGTFREQ